MKNLLFLSILFSTPILSQVIIPRDSSNFWNYNVVMNPYAPLPPFNPVFEQIIPVQTTLVSTSYDTLGNKRQSSETWTESDGKLMLTNSHYNNEVIYDTSITQDTSLILPYDEKIITLSTREIFGKVFKIQRWQRFLRIMDLTWRDTYETAFGLGIIYHQKEWGTPAGDKYTYNLEACCIRDTVYGNVNPIIYRINSLNQGDTAKIVFQIKYFNSGYNLQLVSGNPSLVFTISDTVINTSVVYWYVNVQTNLYDCRFKLTSLADSSIFGYSDFFNIQGPVAVSDQEISDNIEYELGQNFPNPFNPATLIRYRLKERGFVRLNVINMLGQTVKVLVNEAQEAGYYEKQFNASGLASGIYLFRIEIFDKGNIPVFSDIKKTVLLK